LSVVVIFLTTVQYGSMGLELGWGQKISNFQNCFQFFFVGACILPVHTAAGR